MAILIMLTYFRYSLKKCASTPIVKLSFVLAWMHVVPLHAAESIRVLPGTEVSLELSAALSSESAFKGQKFNLLVEKDVRSQGQVVIPKGTEALGSVVRFAKHDIMGKPGELNVRIDYLLFNGQRIPLFAGMGQRGKSSDGAAVVLTALFGPIGMLAKGKEVVFPAGTKFLAYIDQDFEVPFEQHPLVNRAPIATLNSSQNVNALAPSVAIPAPATSSSPAITTDAKATPLPATSEEALRKDNAHETNK